MESSTFEEAAVHRIGAMVERLRALLVRRLGDEPEWVRILRERAGL